MASASVCTVGGEKEEIKLNKVTVYSIGRGQSTLSCFQAAKQKRRDENEKRKTFLYEKCVLLCYFLFLYHRNGSTIPFRIHRFE